jgi:putative transposase
MPEHVHLLLSEPRRATLADALKSLKQGVSRRLIGEAEHFWMKRYHDLNLRTHSQFIEKLRYVHRNPVKRGLCDRPEQWQWSSFRHYSIGLIGLVEIESEWTARIRERSGTPSPGVPFPGCPIQGCPIQACSWLEWAGAVGLSGPAVLD